MTWGWEELMPQYPSVTVQTGHDTVSGRFAGEGVDIVLLHGIGSGAGSWMFLAPGTPYKELKIYNLFQIKLKN